MKTTIAVLLTTALMAAALSCGEGGEGDAQPSAPMTQGTEPRVETPAPVDRDQRSARHVGVAACRECHADRVQDFLETSHPHTSRVVDARVRKRFEGRRRLDTRNPDLRFEPRTDGKVCWVTAVEGTTRRQEEVALVVGSGKIFEGFLYWEGQQLLQLPIGVHAGTTEWANCPGFQDGTADFERAIRPRCMDCHATWMNHVEGSINEYEREGMILGVTCERCHGPGEFHVEHHRAHPEADAAAHILDPGSFTRGQRLDMCAQCHGDPGELVAPAFTYFPGDPLDRHFSREEDDADSVFVHTANQIQRLQNSRCFTDDRLECLSCHDPHENQADTIIDIALDQCATCHESDACKKGPELPADVRPRCVACHMPDRPAIKTTFSTRTEDYLDLVHMREHRIAVHPIESDMVLLAWLDKSSDDAHAPRAEGLRADLAARLKTLATEARSRTRYVESVSLLRRLLTLVGDDEDAQLALDGALELQRGVTRADTLRRDGLAHLEAGRKTEAENAFRAAVIASPMNAEANLNLALLLEESARIPEALGHYKNALTGLPDDARLRNNIGSLLARTGRSAEAIPWFRECLKIDGEHADGTFNLGLALEATGELEDAAPLLEKAAKLRPGEVERHLALTRVETIRGRLTTARAALEAAQALAPGSPGVSFARGALLGREQNHEEAIAAFEETVALDPAHLDAHLALGRYRAAQGSVDAAIGHAFDVLNHDPKNLDAHMLLGDLYAGTRRYDDAATHWGKAQEAAVDAGRMDVARELQQRLSSIGR